MSLIPDELRQLVVRRAAERCEYCQLSQEGQEATFHVDHVVPLSADGPTTPENLALACVSCSLRKAAKLTAVDPTTDEQVPLFNPRQHLWVDHFQWKGLVLEGLTATGRATIVALSLNRERVLAIRQQETRFGRHPKPESLGNGRAG